MEVSKMDHGLPNDPLFTAILRLASKRKDVIIYDPYLDVSTGYAGFLTDVLDMRHRLRQHFSSFLEDENGSMLEK
ncbi:hypothetical protein N7507_009644 [Penicillium longicatenatum]|nr:hypothetical protein N7507_009644 [Penicillium longicatenatum]